MTDMISRRELFDRIWSKPMTRNAEELGTTTLRLSSLAKKLGLPLPRAGHWMKKEVGKAPPTPDYPSDPLLDAAEHQLTPAPPPSIRKRALPTQNSKASSPDNPTETGQLESAPLASQSDMSGETSVSDTPEPHIKARATRKAIGKASDTDRTAIGGHGKFHLLISPAHGERACRILDQLITSIEQRDWSLTDTEQGYAILADGEQIGFAIEEKLDRVPHVVTSAELKAKADYDKQCALADRGIGYRPWRAPAIPEYDQVPNGELVLKFDHDYAMGSIRRSFSDGKRQRLEDLIPLMISSLERSAAAIKDRREENERRKQEWKRQEERRRDLERQARVEGYRIKFLRCQIERKQEIDGLHDLIDHWEASESADPDFNELLDFARHYRTWLEAKLTPEAVAERIAALKLMDDDVYIYDEKRLD